jgi:hypothetical protein
MRRIKARLKLWQSKILRKVYEPATENRFWRVRSNTELKELYKTPPLTGDIKRKRSKWLGHIIRVVTKKLLKVRQKWEGPDWEC